MFPKKKITEIEIINLKIDFDKPHKLEIDFNDLIYITIDFDKPASLKIDFDVEVEVSNFGKANT